MRTPGILAVVCVVLIAAIGGYAWWARPEPARAEPRPPDSVAAPVTPPAMSRVESAPGEPAVGMPGADPVPQQATTLGAEQREQMRLHWDAELLRIYEDVGRDVGLNANESEELIALLVEQRIQYAETPGLDMSVAGVAARHELDAQHQREIDALIGAERSRALGKYQRSMQVRYEVEELRRMLQNTATPLSEAQRKSLIRGGIEKGAYADSVVFTGAESDLALTQEMQARNELAYQLMADVARGVLTAEQFARFEERWEMSRAAYEHAVREK